MNDIVLYSNDCPKCKVLNKKLEQKGISFTKSDDIEFLKKNNFYTVPVLSVDGKLLVFEEAIVYINSL